MSKFLTCDKCKEDYFYTDDHKCPTQTEGKDWMKRLKIYKKDGTDFEQDFIQASR
jgi:uncharacterized Zn ribbon protein